MGDLKEHRFEHFEELVDLLHRAPFVVQHRHVLANGPHLWGNEAQTGLPDRLRNTLR